MNKAFYSSLSRSEQQLLISIANSFDQAAQLIGSEPGIYFEFNVPPDTEQTIPSSLIKKRQDLFTKSGSISAKKV